MPIKSRLAKVAAAKEDQSIEPSMRPMEKPSKKFSVFSLFKKINWRNVKPTSYTPALVVLLIIGSFFLGMLFDKVQYLQSGGQYLGGTAGTAGQQAGAQQQQQPPTGKKFDNSTGPYPIMGNKNAKVTIVEFADFQCPFCEAFFKDTEQSIIKDYVDTGKAKFAFRDYAFLGQESTYAAEAASCANEQGKFWEFHDYLYNHQGQENSGTFNKDKLEGFAATLGLNTEQFNQCLESDKYSKQISDETAAGSGFGVTGTPGIFVNGNLIVGAQPYSVFKTAIDQALAGK